MKPIYVFASENEFLIQNKINELMKDKTDYEIVKYDMTEQSLDQVIEDLDTYNFLAKHKLIIASSCSFLTSEDKTVDLTAFIKYLDHPNEENTLILTCKKLDERKKIVKKLLEVAGKENLEVNLHQLIKDKLEGYEMNNQTIEYLISYCHNNYEKTLNELEKLKLYCYDTKVITKDSIDAIVSKTIDDNIFSLVDAIIQKRKDTSYEIYEELLKHNEEPVKILILVANQFRLIYQVKVLREENLSEEEIAKKLGVHPYRVKLAYEKGRNYQNDEILRILKKLSDLDSDIKQGKTYQNVAFELFVFSL